jgi:DNA repair photolyase
LVGSAAEEQIIREARRWVHENNGVRVGKGRGCYTSPRVSSEIADCSMPMTFDHYSYCSLGCLYCFAYFFKSNNPSIIKRRQEQAHALKTINVETKLAAMKGKFKNRGDELFYEHFYKRKFLLHWGGLADPFCDFEKKNRVGLQFIEGLGEMNYPTLFSFKGSMIFNKDYVRVFDRYAKQRNFAFQVSIVTNSDDLSKQIEIGVAPTSRRIEAIQMLSEMGYWTILRLRPFIVGISDLELDQLLYRSLKAGIRGISLEFFALDARANVGMKRRYEWLAKLVGVKDLMHYFTVLSPKERGTYMRLNRLVKEMYVKKIYQFCVENNLVCGISDPDFKELNTSGSCCAMPDNFPKNRLLENWTRSQLTFHLKEARRHYHKTGETRKLRFNQVYGHESYLDAKGFAEDHVATVGLCTTEAKNMTQRDLLQQQWNNLRSPASPRNYLHGKVLPTGRDGEGNIIYVYNPLEYEGRWTKEGIDLTK